MWFSAGALAASYSEGGKTWTPRSLPVVESWVTAAYDSNTFVVISLGTSSVRSVNNGISWTAATMPDDSNWEVAGGGGVFVAVPSNGSAVSISNNGGLSWSTDYPVVDASWRGVAYKPGYGFLITSLNTIAYSSSDGGVTWDSTPTPASYTWGKLRYRDPYFFLLTSGTVYATSTNGTTWTIRSFSASARDVAYGNNRYVTAFNTTSQVSTSGTGSWQTYSMPSGYWYGLTFGNGVFVCTNNGYESSQILTSYDGATWTIRDAFYNTFWGDAVVAGGNTIIAVGEFETNYYITSP